MRVQSVSLCDADGDVLWLSEGVLGPDEHGYVMDAIAEFEEHPSKLGTERDLEDGRAGVFLPVRAPQGSVVGIAMILIDGKSVTKGMGAKLVTPQVRTVLQRVAVLLKPANLQQPGRADVIALQPPAEAPRIEPEPEPELTLKPEDTQPLLAALELAPAASVSAEPPMPELELEKTAARPAKANGALPPLTSEQIDTILTLELTDDTESPPEGLKAAAAPDPEPVAPPRVPPPPPAPKAKGKAAAKPVPRETSDAAAPPAAKAAPQKASGPTKDLALSVQQLLKLRSGGRTRRYEVLLRARHDAERNELPHTLVQRAAREIGETALDEYVLGELLGFLGANRGIWENEPASFSVNLSAATVSEDGFAQVIEAILERTGVAPEVLGFEIPQSCCVHEPVHVERFANACGKLGCFIVLDDFTLDPRAVPLLRSKTLKLVKIDPKLTTAAMKDRVSQALVVAIAQASKVLGVHCVAKRVESQATREWLSATGIDFAQGFALEGPQPLEALLAPTEG